MAIEDDIKFLDVFPDLEGTGLSQKLKEELESICHNLQEATPALIEIVKYITGVLNLGKIYLSADCELDIDANIKGLHAFFQQRKYQS